MQNNVLERLHLRERADEVKRLRELETKDLAVEAEHGPRPLEGYAGGHTTWASMQDDEAARQEYGRDVTDIAEPEEPTRQSASAELEEEAVL
jgi:hypothetical protein